MDSRAKIDPLDDLLLAQFLCAALEHDEVDVIGLAARPRDNLAPHDEHVQIAVLHRGGVGDELAVDAPDPHAGNRPVEGDVGDLQGRRGAQKGHHIGVVLPVHGEHRGDELRLEVVALGEKRADGAVNNPANEDLPLVGSPLALEEPAGDLSGGKGHFLVIHGEGKEVETFPLAPGRNDGDKHDGLPVGHEDGPVSLPGNVVYLDAEIASCERFLEYLTHSSSFSFFSLLMTIGSERVPASTERQTTPLF